MLSLRATAARTRAVTAIPTLPTPARRPLTTRGDDPESLASEKRRSPPHPPSTLVGNAPGWNEDLATASEAFVKADRETASIDELQQKTPDYVRSHRRPDPEVEQTHASYAREEVGGPLGNSGVGEFEGVVGNDDLGPDDAQVESDGRLVSRRTPAQKDGRSRG